MTIETELIAVLQAQCPRTFPSTAPYGTKLPYLTWTHIGGQTVRYMDNSPASRRNVYLQINVWAATSAQAVHLARQVEDALCASTVLQVTPQGEPVAGYDDGDELRGTVQSFSIWGNR